MADTTPMGVEWKHHIFFYQHTTSSASKPAYIIYFPFRKAELISKSRLSGGVIGFRLPPISYLR
jgi:hypothetical protein